MSSSGSRPRPFRRAAALGTVEGQRGRPGEFAAAVVEVVGVGVVADQDHVDGAQRRLVHHRSKGFGQVAVGSGLVESRDPRRCAGRPCR